MLLAMALECGFGAIPFMFRILHKLLKPANVGCVVESTKAFIIQRTRQMKGSTSYPFFEFAPFLTHRKLTHQERSAPQLIIWTSSLLGPRAECGIIQSFQNVRKVQTNSAGCRCNIAIIADRAEMELLEHRNRCRVALFHVTDPSRPEPKSGGCVKPRTSRQEPGEGANKQTCRDDQNQRKSDLSRHNVICYNSPPTVASMRDTPRPT
jgi:hypothetical protein